MATIHLHGTVFTFAIQPPKILPFGETAKVKIAIENEYVHYQNTIKIVKEELDDLIVSLHRLLAGAYSDEYDMPFEDAGFAVDLYPHSEGDAVLSRNLLRKKDCIAVFRVLMRASNKSFLGGVYSVMLHREELKIFADALRAEFDEIFAHSVHGSGKLHFIAVSPLGYNGCKYWYFDETGKVKAGDYVWVRMGRHDLEQVVYVDCVKRCNHHNIPCPEKQVKDMIKIATQEEAQKALSLLEKTK